MSSAIRTSDLSLGVGILAAGSSKRLGHAKQLVRYQGQNLLQRCLSLASSVAPRALWLTYSDYTVLEAAELGAATFEAIEVSDAELGMSASLRALAKVASAHSAIQGLLILLVDQYQLDQAWLSRLIAAHQAHPDCAIASRYSDGTVGVPAIFPLAWFGLLQSSHGDQGARRWLRTRADVQIVPIDREPGDIDQLSDLLAAQSDQSTKNG